MEALQKALDAITYELVRKIKAGEQIHLFENYVLYFYEGGDSLVVVEENDWKELYIVQYNPKTKEVELTEI